MARVARKVVDERVLKLIRRYLEAGLMEGGITSMRTEGTPQGGPLSPLLSNILLDDLDRELERRGLNLHFSQGSIFAGSGGTKRSWGSFPGKKLSSNRSIACAEGLFQRRSWIWGMAPPDCLRGRGGKVCWVAFDAQQRRASKAQA